MREIKFRGYDEENNLWRYGFYTKLQVGARIFHAIIVEDETTEERFTYYYIHNPKTISQYTGLKDKNGKEIYECDVVKWYINDHYKTGSVIFDMGCFWLDKDFDTGYSICNDWYRGEYEIIGNIHEEKK